MLMVPCRQRNSKVPVGNDCFLILFVGFPEEAEEAETYGSGVNVNKFQHLNYSGLMCFIAESWSSVFF